MSSKKVQIRGHYEQAFLLVMVLNSISVKKLDLDLLPKFSQQTMKEQDISLFWLPSCHMPSASQLALYWSASNIGSVGSLVYIFSARHSLIFMEILFA